MPPYAQAPAEYGVTWRIRSDRPDGRDPGNLRVILLHDITRLIINVSYALDRAVWGAGPVGFHITNVLLHVTNVILLFLVAWRLVEDRNTTAKPLRPGVVAFATAVLF